MIQAATKAADELGISGRAKFRIGTVEDEIAKAKSGSVQQSELLYSNAALHWVPNHSMIFPAMVENLLKPDGVLAVQMPSTRAQASHVLMREALRECGLEEDTKSIRIPSVEAHEGPDFYYKLLARNCTNIDIWTTEYIHQLPPTPSGRHPVLEWVRSTGMLPIISGLGGESSAKATRFLDAYNELLADAYPWVSVDGSKVILCGYKRLFIVARKKK
jgi:trans-aconitate 2-methyltransferase